MKIQKLEEELQNIKNEINLKDKIISEKDKKIDGLEKNISQYSNILMRENSKTANLNLKIKDLENELKKNNTLLNDNQNIINELKNEIEKLKLINNELNKKVNDEKNKTTLLIKRNKQLENEINKYQNINNLGQSQEQKMIKLYNTIEELQLEISRFPFSLKEGEKMICLNFDSNDQKIRDSIICKNTDIFSEVEIRLYKLYPIYSEKALIFLKDGKKINRNKTLDENNIHDHDKIICFECNFMK